MYRRRHSKLCLRIEAGPPQRKHIYVSMCQKNLMKYSFDETRWALCVERPEEGDILAGRVG